MNRWAKTQLGIASVGAALFLWAGVVGFGVGADRARFALHTQLGLVATLTLLLGLIWVAAYAVECRRRLRGLPGAPAEGSARVSRSLRWVPLATSVAVAATIGHFLLAGRIFARAGASRAHLWSAGGTLLVLLVALGVSARGLSRHQRLAERLREADRVLDSRRS